MSPSFSTRSANELILAFIATDYLSGANTTVTSVAGGGLTWALVGRTNVQSGTSEIWRAFAPSALSLVVSATLSQGAVATITVVSFSNVDTSGTNGSGAIGATASGNSINGAPTATLITTRNNSWVFGVGNDYDNASPRTPGANQVVLHQALPPVGDTYWVQRTLNPTPATGTSVTINDTAPAGDRYNLFIAEILPLNAGSDTTPPTVSMTAPANNATVSGTTVAVTATASDNVAVVGVQFKLDGANLGVEVTSGPYAVTWNSTTASNGSPSLTAVARDAAGNTTTATAVTVTVNNDTTPPTVSMTAPANGATVSGTTVTVSATASDNVAVTGVQFKLDGANLGAEVTTVPYQYIWDSKTASNGSHSLTAVARDAAGNTTTATAVTVTVNNDTTPPTVSMTAPANAATVGGATVAVSATAADNVAVAGVQFTLDGANLGAEDTVSPFTVTWNATALTNGSSHSLGAVARDAAGNTTTATAVTVTVDNAPPTVSMTAPADGGSVAGTVAVSATASDNVGVVGVQFKLDGANLGAEDTVGPYTLNWTTTTASNGNHVLTAVARDAAGNTTTATAVTVMVDNVSPIVAMTAPADGASVAGTVAVSATASDTVGGVVGVQFKLDGANLGAESTVGPYTVNWTTTTASNGSHSLTAVARDAAGNSTTATPVTVTVNNVDATPPTVSMTAPANGATVSGASVTLSATASDNVAVIGVQFTLDGVNVGAEDTASPYSINWSSIGTSNGPHTLAAIARDGAGNTATAAVSVTVSNDVTPPTVSMTAPVDGATVSGMAVVVSANASDNVAVVGVQFKLDGVNLGAEDTASPYSISWNSTTATNAPHTLTAVARDAAGNTTTATAVTVTVDNASPTVAMTAPAGGATVAGTNITVSANASDNVAVVGVQFKLDGLNLGLEDTASPYSIAWNTTTATNGSHSLTAVARDGVGNTTTSAAVTVTVDNAPPTVSITAPAGGASVSGSTVTVSATASDNVAVAGVQFQLDGVNLGAEDIASPYSIAWNTTTASDSSHTLTAVARATRPATRPRPR